LLIQQLRNFSVFPPNCIIDYRFGITVPTFQATLVTVVHRNSDAAENVTFCGTLFKGNLLIPSGDPAGLAKDTLLYVWQSGHVRTPMDH
jgi:hypothetical protein